MKLSLTFLCTSLIVQFSNADLTTKWNIGNVVPADPDGNNFEFNYPGLDSTFITNMDTQVQVTMYAFACKADGAATYGQIGITDVSNSAFVMQSLGYDDAATPNLELKFKTVPAEMAKSSAITSVPVNDISEMTFCVRLGLFSGSNEINFQETQVTLTVTMTGDFQVDSFDVKPKDQTASTSSQGYSVEATLCVGQTAPFNQGTAIKVCVAPDSSAKTDGVILSSVDLFTWKRGAIEQPAITSANNPSSDGLSLLTVNNDQEIQVESVLFAAFYATDGSVGGSGAATMAFPPLRRLLRDSNERDLQEAGDVVSPFELSAPVVKANDGPAALQTAGGAGTSITVGAIIVGFVSAILLD